MGVVTGSHLARCEPMTTFEFRSGGRGGQADEQCGEKPFAGETVNEILASQLDRSTLIRPRDHNPDIPPKMEETILKCLAHNPNERYHFTSILNHDLRDALYVK